MPFAQRSVAFLLLGLAAACLPKNDLSEAHSGAGASGGSTGTAGAAGAAGSGAGAGGDTSGAGAGGAAGADGSAGAGGASAELVRDAGPTDAGGDAASTAP